MVITFIQGPYIKHVLTKGEEVRANTFMFKKIDDVIYSAYRGGELYKIPKEIAYVLYRWPITILNY